MNGLKINSTVCSYVRHVCSIIMASYHIIDFYFKDWDMIFFLKIRFRKFVLIQFLLVSSFFAVNVPIKQQKVFPCRTVYLHAFLYFFINFSFLSFMKLLLQFSMFYKNLVGIFIFGIFILERLFPWIYESFGEKSLAKLGYSILYIDILFLWKPFLFANAV